MTTRPSFNDTTRGREDFLLRSVHRCSSLLALRAPAYTVHPSTHTVDPTQATFHCFTQPPCLSSPCSVPSSPPLRSAMPDIVIATAPYDPRFSSSVDQSKVRAITSALLTSIPPPCLLLLLRAHL